MHPPGPATLSNDDIHKKLETLLGNKGAFINALYFCPHHPSGIIEYFTKKCNCRKPLPGMLLQAAADLKINLYNSYFIGDKLTDMEAGLAAGISNLFLLSQGEKIKNSGMEINTGDCLLSVAKSLVKGSNRT